MSLTSRIFNFFAPNHTTPTNDRESIGLVESEDYGAVRDNIDLQAGRRKQNIAMEKKEEECRPPYIHVRPATRRWRKQRTTPSITS